MRGQKRPGRSEINRRRAMNSIAVGTRVEISVSGYLPYSFQQRALCRPQCLRYICRRNSRRIVFLDAILNTAQS
jgi:hypothetical protein